MPHTLLLQVVSTPSNPRGIDLQPLRFVIFLQLSFFYSNGHAPPIQLLVVFLNSSISFSNLLATSHGSWETTPVDHVSFPFPFPR